MAFGSKKTPGLLKVSAYFPKVGPNLIGAPWVSIRKAFFGRFFLIPGFFRTINWVLGPFSINLPLPGRG